ncbi:MAG TPA: hypothetical protein VGI31_11850 [Streptosporangiaceae bacterium]
MPAEQSLAGPVRPARGTACAIPANGHTGSRISIPFFHMPNHDAPIEPLFPFSDTRAEERFKMVTTPGEWYMERLADTLS